MKAHLAHDTTDHPWKLNMDPSNGRTEIEEPKLAEMIMTKSEAQLL